MADETAVRATLEEVEDPEMKISVIDLGLIYDVRIEGEHAEIDMTLTSPGCPIAAELMATVHRAALTTEGIESVHVNLTFSPLWNPKIHANRGWAVRIGNLLSATQSNDISVALTVLLISMAMGHGADPRGLE